MAPRIQNPLQKQPNAKGPSGPLRELPSYLVAIILVFLLAASAYSLIGTSGTPVTDITLSTLATDVKAGKVTAITVKGGDLVAEYADGSKKQTKKEVEASLSQTLTNYGVTPDELSKLAVDVKDPSSLGFWLFNILPIVVPIILIAVFIWMLSRQMKGSAMQAFTFGQSKARIIDPDNKDQLVTFKDVAGVREAKEELKEIVEFLRNPKKFLDIGARIPKGVLLMGAPGTGKTLLARAVAGEAKVPFLYLSGSEFVEMFVGVGASRVRDLFKMAKKIAPAIIFIDEIDAVGRHRGGGYGGGNDEREQTLNQILVEMDGFEPSEKVIIMAATNRPDVLDPALLRPGRFDRRVVLDPPDVRDREEILTIHSKKRPLGPDVDLHVIAERTPGFAGADLSNLMNEGAILAARENRKEITQYDIIRSIEKVMLGPERKSHILSKEEKRLTAFHEAGHALVASVLPHADPVHKITIISRGKAAGYTLKLPLEEKRMQSKKEFLDDIAVAMGGYAAEQLIFGDVTTGPSNDIAVATNLARNMVSRFGMSDAIGPVGFGDTEQSFMGMPMTSKPYSEEVSALLDAEVSRLMREAKLEAERVITEHRKVLDAIAERLVEVETIEREEFEQLLVLHGIKPKRHVPNEVPKVISE